MHLLRHYIYLYRWMSSSSRVYNRIKLIFQPLYLSIVLYRYKLKYVSLRQSESQDENTYLLAHIPINFPFFLIQNDIGLLFPIEETYPHTFCSIHVSSISSSYIIIFWRLTAEEGGLDLRGRITRHTQWQCERQYFDMNSLRNSSS